MSDPTFTRLFRAARVAMAKAYAPYSRVKVGAALMTSDGHIYTGCNVENASYGATICAERTAIVKAASDGHRKIIAILVVTNQREVWPPCGMCRQMLAEFAGPQTVVYFTNLKKRMKVAHFSALMPGAFTKDFLSSRSR